MFRRLYVKWLVCRGKAVDIWLKSKYPADVLSNLCSNEFRFDGMVCGSMEGFLQSLKQKDEDKQRQICAMEGKDAKKMTSAGWQTDQMIWWKGVAIDRQSEDYIQLVRRAYQAMFDHNERFRTALMSTRGRTLYHSRGESNPFKTALTERELCQILTELRDNYDKRDKNGEPLTKIQFDCIESIGDENPLHIGYMGRHPYVIRESDGEVIDLFQIDATTLIEATEKVMNWVLPGLQLFYRDTDTPINVAETFHVGDTLRAGFFIDMSPYAGKPMHRYRYIIASSHAASLVMPGDRYPLHVLHYNSYLKVMDIYENAGVTQIFLLHVPAKAIFSPCLGSQLNISFNGKETIVDIARKSLDAKLTFPPRELLEEKEWLDRTSWHVGIDRDGQPFSLFPNVLVVQDDVSNMGKAVRKMAKDTDSINLILESPKQ